MATERHQSINILLAPGVTVVVGSNNAGKTLLLETLAGVRRCSNPPQGQRRIEKFTVKQVITKEGAPKKKVALCSPGVYCHVPIYEPDSKLGSNPCLCVTVGSQIGTAPSRTGHKLVFADDGKVSRLACSKTPRAVDAHKKKTLGPIQKQVDESGFFRASALPGASPGRGYSIYNRVFGDTLTLSAKGFRVYVANSHGSSDVYNLQEMGLGARTAVGVLMGIATALHPPAQKVLLEEAKDEIPAEADVICLDEPAQFLHPPSATRLAHELVDFAKAKKKRLVVTTHSLPFLRGILSKCLASRDKGLQVVRPQSAHGRTALYCMDHKSLWKAARSGHGAMSGLWEAVGHEVTIVVESYNDALVYNLAWSAMVDCKLDVYWLGATGGCGAVPELMGALSELGVRAYALVDLDMAMQTTTWKPWSKFPGDASNKFKVAVESVKAIWGTFTKNHGGKAKHARECGVMADALRDDVANIRNDLQQLLRLAAGINVLLVPFGALESLLWHSKKHGSMAVRALSIAVSQLTQADLKRVYPMLWITMSYTRNVLESKREIVAFDDLPETMSARCTSCGFAHDYVFCNAVNQVQITMDIMSSATLEGSEEQSVLESLVQGSFPSAHSATLAPALKLFAHITQESATLSEFANDAREKCPVLGASSVCDLKLQVFGDSEGQALKTLLVARYTGIEVSIHAADNELPLRVKVSLKHGDLWLHGANAICRYFCLMTDNLSCESLAVDHWIEWESTKLHKAATMQSAVAHLEGILAAKSYLVGSSLSLADIIVGAAMHHILLDHDAEIGGTPCPNIRRHVNMVLAQHGAEAACNQHLTFRKELGQ